ncbi:uncharacterized protein F5147DRAFT_551199, partial [Suillus discolor]
VDLREVDRLRDLADTTENRNDVFLGAMAFGDVLPQPHDAGLRLDRMGDPLAERAWMLLSGIQYPGDRTDCPDSLAADRFHLYRVSATEYVIMDSCCRLDPELTIPIVLLTNPCFEVDRWYWCYVGLHRGFDKKELRGSERKRTWRSSPMGDALAEHATYLLDAERNYYNDGPACQVPRRFECNFVGGGLYEVYDTALQFAATVSEELLLNSRFNVSNWYAKQLAQGFHALQDAMEEWSCEWNL